MSNSGLANVLQKLRSNPELLEAGVSRWAVKRKRVADVSAQSEFGDVFRSMDLETKDGGSLKCWYAHPVCILERALTRSPGFRDLFLRLLEGNPAKWHLVAYSDEVTPGNNLKPLNRRKCWVIYWSFCEMKHHLQNENCWFIMSVLRTDEVNEAGLQKQHELFWYKFFTFEKKCKNVDHS